MEKDKKTKQEKKEKKKNKKQTNQINATDKLNESNTRGRYFKGTVKKIIKNRAVIEFNRLIFIKKYERFAKAKTKLHAYLPKHLMNEIRIGNVVKIRECRPKSKIIHFIIVRKIKK